MILAYCNTLKHAAAWLLTTTFRLQGWTTEAKSAFQSTGKAGCGMEASYRTAALQKTHEFQGTNNSLPDFWKMLHPPFLQVGQGNWTWLAFVH